MNDPFSRPDYNPPGSEALLRWVTIWNVISVVMALFTTTFSLLDGPQTLPNIAQIIGFVLLFLVWYSIFIIRLDRWGRSSPWLALSFAVIMLGLAYMTSINGIYYIQLFSLYGIVFSVLEARLAIPLTTLLSIMGAGLIIYNSRMPWSQATGVLIGFGIAAFFSMLMGLFISAIIRQSAERQQIIDQLKAAREDLARAERQAGILEERQRLAREIHDTLAQGFTSIVMHLETADQALSTANARSVDQALSSAKTQSVDQTLSPDPALATVRLHLDRARATARESLAEARRFVWALRTEPADGADPADKLDPFGRSESLAQAIRRVAAHWAEETGSRAQVEISGTERPLPSPYEVTLLRSAQEALVNIRKHANAHQATLTLTYMEDQVILDVQDDGQGFIQEQSARPSPLSDLSPGSIAAPEADPAPDPAAAPAQPAPAPQNSAALPTTDYTNTAPDSGFGLIGMRERAEQLGGSVIIESVPGEGTTLVVQLPLAPTNPSAPEAL